MTPRTARSRAPSLAATCVLGIAATGGAGAGRAQGEEVPPERVAEALRIVAGPWSPSEPTWDAARDAVTATALALPPDPALPVEGLGVRHLRLQARNTAVRRVHAWVDDALAARLAPPWVAQHAHDAVDGDARVSAERTFLDGGAAVEVSVPGPALRAAAPDPRLPWAGGAGS